MDESRHRPSSLQLSQSGRSLKGAAADLVRLEESVIENIEEADYEGDFLAMASRIANALHWEVEVQFVPVEGKESVEEYSLHHPRFLMVRVVCLRSDGLPNIPQDVFEKRE